MKLGHSWTAPVIPFARIPSRARCLTEGLPSLVLFSTSPRQPRRKLPKRKRKRRGDETEGNVVTEDDGSIWETAEVRPLISFKSKELGEDYWMDEEALKKEQERRKQKRPTPQPGQVPDEKLWDEILSPYKQNWIGVISIAVVILATIVTKFPELLQTPTISIPDL